MDATPPLYCVDFEGKLGPCAVLLPEGKGQKPMDTYRELEADLKESARPARHRRPPPRLPLLQNRQGFSTKRYLKKILGAKPLAYQV